MSMTLFTGRGCGALPSRSSPTLEKENQMNTTLKYLPVFGIVMALVLIFGVTASRTVHVRDFGYGLEANSVRGAGDLDKEITSKPIPNCPSEPGVFGCGRIICTIPSWLENTPCPLNVVNSE